MTRIDAPLTVLVSGASGLIGTALTARLEGLGHRVLRLVRRRPQGPDEVNWAPSAHTVDFQVMDRVDAVVGLSGAPLSHLPWTSRYRREIRSSRTEATRTLADAINQARRPPAVFLSASAVGVYGDRPGERLTEASASGEGYLAEVCEAWERAAGVADVERLVTLRTGLVISRDGGALKPLIPVTRLGLAARIGTGGQHWPWISLHDEVEAIVHLLTASTLTGPVNLAGPTPATADRVTTALAAQLHRRERLVLPEPVIGAAMGDAGRELLLASQKVLPAALLDDGFVFRDTRVEQAIAAAFASARTESAAG